MTKAELILTALKEPILLLDNQLCAVMANPSFYSILQINAGELEGCANQEFVSNRNGTLQLAKVLEPVVKTNGSVEGAEVICTLPDGTEIILSVSARPVPAEQGYPRMILVELRDITTEKHAEQTVLELGHALEMHIARLELANKEFDSFSHSVSHDLRTPLRLMDKVTREMLFDYGADIPSGAIAIINMISDASQQMERHVESLLKFSQTIQSPMKKRVVDLQQLTRDAVETLKGEQGDRAIEFVIEDLPPCYVDRTLFREVLLNLLANSLKFTRPREKAHIHVGYLDDAGETVYFVRDNGIGFDMSTAAFLFTAFHRIHRSGNYEGSGIGLALVRRIVERHGGRIWCESKIDEGATFYFTVGNDAESDHQPKGPLL